jgi:hypothetical protein
MWLNCFQLITYFMMWCLAKNPVWSDRTYMYDFVVTDPVRRAAEFNGDSWHANPARYKATDPIQHPGGTVLASEVWAKDEKLKILEARGFEVMVVWEGDYLAAPLQLLKR